ncbi:hypothetical protein JOF41_000519 [Saccharothrix coeruleofusca]|uniref:substrate-binding domain-containing protein n=1 Tax=Saccharothrix coeruleofusca TaxID=33919 RepID=UPI001AE57F9F|nr:substrate-binding domain-containing protein [Saccharothrix coeruleofusca]MBP2334341.1 hypothetical protein [Saccharothrix coeruleofusca]
MGTPQPAVHRTIVAVDVVAFGERSRPQQDVIRRGLYSALEHAFDECGIPWGGDWPGTYREDRGDGLFVLLPPGVAKRRVVSALLHLLDGELRRYNAMLVPQARIQLRAAVTAGDVAHDGNGAVGAELVLAFRLLDSAPLRAELARSGAVLGLVVSERFFDDVIRDEPACEPELYHRVEVDHKEVHTAAWLRLYGSPARAEPAGPPWWSRLPRPKRSAVLLVLLLVLLLPGDALLAVPPAVPPCPAPVQLNVLTSAEKATALRGLAVDFERDSRGVDGDERCRLVNVHVGVDGSAHEVVRALSRGWPDQDLAARGPEPHVWLPDTSWEVAEVAAALRADDRDVRLADRGPVAYSPLVLGVPAAEWSGWPNQEFRWRDVPNARLPLAGVDARSTGAGAAAAAALVHTALGGANTAALTGDDVPRRLREIALRTAGEPAPACPSADRMVLASEKAVLKDHPCLKVLYPSEGTLHLDHPFVEVRRTSTPPNERRQAVVGRFLDYLRAPSAQGTFRWEGFRDLNWVPPWREDVRPDKPAQLDAAVDVAAVREAWESARRAVDVVLAVDGSAKAAELADRLEDLVGGRGEVRRREFSADRLPSAVAEAVAERGAGVPVVVLVERPRPVSEPLEPVRGPPVRVHGVGFTAGSCSAVTQLGAIRAAYGGTCFDSTEHDVRVALDRVAGGLWGSR